MDVDTMPAGREMDRLIALLMGWEGVGPNAIGQWGGVNPKATDPQEWYHLPHYSTDITDAWPVWEMILPNRNIGEWVIAPMWNGMVPASLIGWRILEDLGGWDPTLHEIVSAETAPLVICRAVLKATGYPG